jgi:hypothetical protein
MRDDGGPAFPSDPKRMQMSPGGAMVAVGHEGMTLRDWFAGQLVGHIATDPTVGASITASSAETVAIRLARISYVMADAMIEERNKK